MPGVCHMCQDVGMKRLAGFWRGLITRVKTEKTKIYGERTADEIYYASTKVYFVPLILCCSISCSDHPKPGRKGGGGG